MSSPPPLELPPRWVHVQADYELPRDAPGGRLGRVPWEEHREACAGLGLGAREAERVAQRGGLTWREMSRGLGREVVS